MLRILSATALALVVLGSAEAGAGLPEPVEFDRTAPPRPAGVASNQGFVSPVLEARRRFNLVGLTWRGRAEPEIALRARRRGGDWTRWTPATGHHARSASEPVWVGRARFVQYRMSRSVPGLRIRFIDTTRTASALARSAKRKRARKAAGRRPRIRRRAAWGAETCPPRAVHYGRVRAAVVHHTVTANAYTKRQTRAAILAICRFHRFTNGWDDVGYNFLVDRFGRIWEGRAGGIDEAVMGAHAQGYNAQTTGISNLGTFTEVPQSDAAIGAMAKLIRWKLARHGVRKNGTTRMTSAGGPAARYPAGTTRRFNRVSGHRDTGITACPGEQLYRQLPELRERVGERLHPGAPVVVEAELPETVVYSPDGVSFGGRLLDRDGIPIEGAELELQELGELGWQTLATGTSGGDGGYAASAPLTYNLILRWRFAGDADHRPYRGDGVVVNVAPAISLAASSTTVEPEEQVRLSGSIYPWKTAGVRLVAERLEDGVWRRVFRRRMKIRDGHFTRRKAFDTEGDYRFVVWFEGDTLNAPALSPYVSVRVEDPLLPF